jgi:hypothetical protein
VPVAKLFTEASKILLKVEKTYGEGFSADRIMVAGNMAVDKAVADASEYDHDDWCSVDYMERKYQEEQQNG